MNFLPLGILIAYIVGIIIATVFSASQESKQEYMIGDRNIGPFGMMTSIVGNLRDGAGIAAWVILSAFYGFGALWLTVGLCAGLALLAVWAPRVRQLAAEKDYVSVTELLSDSIGRWTGRLALIIIALTSLLYAASQMFVAGSLSATLFGLSAGQSIILVGIVVAAYLICGGYKATILTGIVQWFVLLLILVIPFLLKNDITAVVEPASFLAIDWQTILGFFGLSFLVVFSSADIWQLIFSSKTGISARRGLLQSIPVYFVISIGMVLFGLSIMVFLGSNANAETAFFDLFTSVQLPAIVQSLISVFILAAIMSTLDSQVFLFTSTLIKEFKPKLASSDQRLEKYTKLAIILMMIVLVVIATQIIDLVQFLFSAVTLGTILVPVLVYTITNKRFSSKTDSNWLIALIIGIGVYTYMFAKGSFDNILLTIIPALVTAISGYLLLLKSKY